MRWKIELSEFFFEIVHKAGKKNVNADALRRNVSILTIDFSAIFHVANINQAAEKYNIE